MITKDFHYTKDFPLIKGKSFVIMCPPLSAPLPDRIPRSKRSVLTGNATWAFKFAGETDLGPVVGREEILEFFREARETETSQRRHNLVNVVLRRANADAALAQAYLMLTSNVDGGSRMVGTGFYTFRLERAGGEWRIADLFLGTDNAWWPSGVSPGTAGRTAGTVT